MNMHNTLSAGFKGFIDNFYTENGNLRLSGWITPTIDESVENITYHLDIGRELTIYASNERQDVYDFYNQDSKAFLNCGFDISIPVTEQKDVQFFALVKGQKHALFNLSLEKDNIKTVETQLIDETSEITIRKNTIPDLVVVDNFYDDPIKVREIALAQSYEPDLRYHKGNRTSKRFLPNGIKQAFEGLLGAKIINWTNYGYNGVFQYCAAEDPLVYHSDYQRFAGAIYLTPDAPISTGTSLYRSKKYAFTNSMPTSSKYYKDAFAGGFYDGTKFEKTDDIGNIFNRLVLWNAHYIHSASQYFGQTKEDSRLFHLFFFDIEE